MSETQPSNQAEVCEYCKHPTSDHSGCEEYDANDDQWFNRSWCERDGCHCLSREPIEQPNPSYEITGNPGKTSTIPAKLPYREEIEDIIDTLGSHMDWQTRDYALAANEAIAAIQSLITRVRREELHWCQNAVMHLNDQTPYERIGKRLSELNQENTR